MKDLITFKGEIISSLDMVNRFLEKENELLELHRVLKLDWPFVIEAIYCGIDYVTTCLQLNGEALVDVAHRNALIAYHDNRHNVDSIRAKVFIDTFTYTLALHLAGLKIKDSEGFHWHANSGSYLLIWLLEYTKPQRKIDLESGALTLVQQEVGKAEIDDTLRVIQSSILSPALAKSLNYPIKILV